jgi:hypothetical protein
MELVELVELVVAALVVLEIITELMVQLTQAAVLVHTMKHLQTMVATVAQGL